MAIGFAATSVHQKFLASVLRKGYKSILTGVVCENFTILKPINPCVNSQVSCSDRILNLLIRFQVIDLQQNILFDNSLDEL